jgi:hypothetical protein
MHKAAREVEAAELMSDGVLIEPQS